MNWAQGYDATGRPIFSPDGQYWKKKDGTGIVYPGDAGSHSFQPMSFSPATQLAYIPSCDFGTLFRDSAFSVIGGTEISIFPHEPAEPGLPKVLGRLVAWNPITQALAWSFPYETPCNGGILSTAGNLVFQGDARGTARAFTADQGKLLWTGELDSAIQSAPITYLHQGKQYVLFLTGVGGGTRTIFSRFASSGPPRAIALALGGKRRIPHVAEMPLTEPAIADDAKPESVKQGEHTYASMWCVMCHGERVAMPLGPSLYPDLRRITRSTYDSWLDIVIGGSRSDRGMMSFADVLTQEQALAIRDYVVHKAWTDYREQEAGKH